MINSAKIKDLAKKHGADLCGIASVERFDNAPYGFHPKDIFEPARSLISIACKITRGSVFSRNLIPYSTTEDIAEAKINNIALSLSLDLEASGISCVIIPSVPYDYWDDELMEGKGILSLKHIAYYSGIGFIRKNALLCTKEFGSLVCLGAIVTDALLDQDKIFEGEPCEENCNLCIENCPVGAIENYRVDQKKCRSFSEIINKRGIEITVCNNCRRVCPHLTGMLHETTL